MASKTINWNDGSGDKMTITYTGSGNGVATVQSDNNNTKQERIQVVTFKTNDGLKEAKLTVRQSGVTPKIDVLSRILLTSDGRNNVFQLDANVDWQINITSTAWGDNSGDSITLSRTSGGPGGHLIVVNTPANVTGMMRSYGVSISGAGIDKLVTFVQGPVPESVDGSMQNPGELPLEPMP